MTKARPKTPTRNKARGGGASRGASNHAALGRRGSGLWRKARSPFGAPPRRLRRRPNARTQPRPRFTRSNICGRYPHHRPRLSEAPRSPVVLPAGTMPGPPGSGLRNRPREPRSLHLQDRIRNVPLVSEAAPAFSCRRSFVKRERLSLDSAALFAAAEVASRPFSRSFCRFKRNL